MDKANEKYRKRKASVQFFVPWNFKHEFKVACVEKGVTIKDTLMKFMAEFVRKA